MAAAQTFGRGVVASDLPYFREMLAPEPEAGVTFPAGDAGALAVAVRRFFETSSEERGAASRRLADRYSWEKVVAPIARWLHEHLGESQRVAFCLPEAVR